MKTIAILLAAATLTACGANIPRVTSSSPRTVGVLAFKGLGEAQALADAECAKHGRYARWISGDVNYVFDCVQ